MQIAKEKTKPIVAALKLDSSDHSVLAATRYFARRLHAPVELVHSIRPILSYVGSGDATVNPYYGYEMNFALSSERAARTQLSQLVQTLDDIEVRAHVVRDFPADAVLGVVQDYSASMIVCGVRSKDQEKDGKSFLSGLSTGLTLASEATVPVLLVPPDLLGFNDPLRLLIADNLESEGDFALETAMKLANDLHAEQLVHVHVQNATFREIDHMIDSVRESMIRGQMPSDPLLNRELYMERISAQTVEEMVRRCREHNIHALNSTLYEAVCRFGHPAEEVHNEVLNREIQLMIFGRHHLIRKHTLSLGRIPYNAMIEDRVATLVVPDDAHYEMDTAGAFQREDRREARFGHTTNFRGNHV
ncbi:MAG: universal stress protein [Chitinophagaceae bacterium]|nr:universal stress protein [Oligoflexus sp.]